jgi:hypothetical protein
MRKSAKKAGGAGEDIGGEPLGKGVFTDWVVGRKFFCDVPLKRKDVAEIRREAKNAKDPNAIAVFKGGDQIGYLPRTTVQWLAPLYDKKMLNLRAVVTGEDTPDGCAPLALTVELRDPEALGKEAVLGGKQDMHFANLFAAWRDRGEYEPLTLKKFCDDAEKNAAEFSPPSMLLCQMLSHYCTEKENSGTVKVNPDESDAMTERREMFLEFLKVEGYVPNIDKDGDIHFKYEGGNYYICISDDDEFFRIIYPAFWSIDDKKEYERVLRAAAAATQNTKAAKVFPVDNDTWASIEMFVAKQADVKPVFSRLMRALKCAIDSFREEMSKSSGK